jgi:hypothetical protein
LAGLLTAPGVGSFVVLGQHVAATLPTICFKSRPGGKFRLEIRLRRIKGHSHESHCNSGVADELVHFRPVQPVAKTGFVGQTISPLQVRRNSGCQLVPDLVKISELFLVPSSFLVAALGTADTNLHRAAVSALGLIVSALWQICAREALVEAVTTKPDLIRTARIRVLAWFPLVFITGWLFSVVIHLMLAGRALGQA